ncbi:MAG: flavin reductase family protein [Magnetospiraceae bacterium]
MTFDNHAFRAALGQFTTGIAVVTAMAQDRPVGLTVNSFTSVSLDPPLILVSLGRSTNDLDAYTSSAGFTVNILSEAQRSLSDKFAQKDTDKFAGVTWEPGENGCPVLPGALATIQCEVHSVVDGGDHFLVLGKVVHLAHSEGVDPLVYYRGGYRTLA